MKSEVTLIVPSDWTKIWRQVLLPQSPWDSSAAGHYRRCLLLKSNIVIINNKRVKWAKLLIGRIWDQYIEKSQKAVRLWNGRLSALNNHRWQGPLPGTRPLLPPLQLEWGPSFQATHSTSRQRLSALPARLGARVLSPWGSILNLFVWRRCSLIFQPLSNFCFTEKEAQQLVSSLVKCFFP